MKILYKSFEELSSKQLEDLFRLRQQVFIIEQTCLYEDIDGYDGQANHLCFYDDELVAYLRLFPEGIKYEAFASLGRIVVAPDYRGSGIGPKLILKGIELCESTSIKIEAQAALEKYYTELGFTTVSEVYVVDDIEHIEMTLEKKK